MTDRIKALTVVLEQDIRVDDIEPLVNAIEQLRGVACVKKSVADITDAVAYNRARIELQTMILKVFETQAKRDNF